MSAAFQEDAPYSVDAASWLGFPAGAKLSFDPRAGVPLPGEIACLVRRHGKKEVVRISHDLRPPSSTAGDFSQVFQTVHGEDTRYPRSQILRIDKLVVAPERTFETAGEFLPDHWLKPAQRESLREILPTKWSPAHAAVYLDHLDVELGSRFHSYAQREPTAQQRDRGRELATRTASMRHALERAFGTMEERLATALLRVERDRKLADPEAPPAGTLEFGELCRRLHLDLTTLESCAAAVADRTPVGKDVKVTNINAALLADCLVAAFASTFGKLPSYAPESPLLLFASQVAELIELDQAKSMRIGRDLLRQSIDRCRLVSA